MTAPESPSAFLLRAADRLRSLSAPASKGPWRVSFMDGVTPVVDSPGRVVAEARDLADATWIAGMPPELGPALAGWLEYEARQAAGIDAHAGRPVYPLMLAGYERPLAVARVILGEAFNG